MAWTSEIRNAFGAGMICLCEIIIPSSFQFHPSFLIQNSSAEQSLQAIRSERVGPCLVCSVASPATHTVLGTGRPIVCVW